MGQILEKSPKNNTGFGGTGRKQYEEWIRSRLEACVDTYNAIINVHGGSKISLSVPFSFYLCIIIYKPSKIHWKLHY